MKINLSHGSGGKSTSDLIETIFAKHLSNPILNQMEDAAVLQVNGRIACTTDSFVITPIFYPGGDIGKLSVCGTVNDLLMMGATPKYLTVGFILEEGLDIEDLEQVVISMAHTAKQAGVQIIAGDTKVIEGNGGLYINTTGIGEIAHNREIRSSQCEPSDVILVSGTMGDHHACIMSTRMGIENGILSDNTPLNNPVNALLKSGVKIKAMRDITRGGLATVLNEIADSSKCQALIEEKNIPVNPVVKGVCDILGLDPLYMGNEGKFLVVVPLEDAYTALDLLNACEESKHAKILGSFQRGNGVVMQTNLGVQRKIDVLYGEGLPRIC